MKNEDLIAAAKSNDLDNFKLAYYSAIENALIAGLDQNKDFFTLLFNNKLFSIRVFAKYNTMFLHV